MLETIKESSYLLSQSRREGRSTERICERGMKYYPSNSIKTQLKT